MKEVAEWQNYPSVEPPENGKYLVSVRIWETRSSVKIASFHKKGSFNYSWSGWDTGGSCFNDSNYPVYAWRSIPEALDYPEPAQYQEIRAT